MNKTILTMILAIGMVAVSFAQFSDDALSLKAAIPGVYDRIQVRAFKYYTEPDARVSEINAQTEAFLEVSQTALKGGKDSREISLWMALNDLYSEEINGLHTTDHIKVLEQYKQQI